MSAETQYGGKILYIVYCLVYMVHKVSTNFFLIFFYFLYFYCISVQLFVETPMLIVTIVVAV